MGRRYTFAMVDVDHFKRVNDTYGHQAGDLVLVRLCELINKSLRGPDIIGRVGGEEFAVFSCLNTSDAGMAMLEGMVRRELSGWV